MEIRKTTQETKPMFTKSTTALNFGPRTCTECPRKCRTTGDKCICCGGKLKP